MKVVLDRFGRIVIPKAVRKRLGVVPGDALKMEFEDDHLKLSTSAREGRLVRINGVLVWDGGGPPLSEDIVEETRKKLLDERHAKIIGRSK